MSGATLAAALAATVPGWAGVEAVVRPGLVPMASPMYQGVDGEAFRLRHPDGRTLWAKVMQDDAWLFADPGIAVRAAERAGAVGIGPRVLASDAAAGALVMEDVSATHRAAKPDDLAHARVREAAVKARKAFQAGPRVGRARSVFDHVEALVVTAEAAGMAPGAGLPQDLRWMLGNHRTAAAAIRAAGRDTVPVHGDGNAGNMLIGGDGSVLLVDWDMAADTDPYEDLGSLLAEAHPFDPAAEETFEMFHGRPDARLFNRARLAGIADDLRWGLIGAILARTSVRNHLEFLKYADWRLLRCRFAMRDPRFEERVRRV